jgi:hypothetical protein
MLDSKKPFIQIGTNAGNGNFFNICKKYISFKKELDIK